MASSGKPPPPVPTGALTGASAPSRDDTNLVHSPTQFLDSNGKPLPALYPVPRILDKHGNVISLASSNWAPDYARSDPDFIQAASTEASKKYHEDFQAWEESLKRDKNA